MCRTNIYIIYKFHCIQKFKGHLNWHSTHLLINHCWNVSGNRKSSALSGICKSFNAFFLEISLSIQNKSLICGKSTQNFRDKSISEDENHRHNHTCRFSLRAKTIREVQIALGFFSVRLNPKQYLGYLLFSHIGTRYLHPGI